MKCEKWNDNWKFWEEKDTFALIWKVPETARNVTLPHDAMIEKPANPQSRNGTGTGYRDGGTYVYEKKLYMDDTASAQTYILRFDGIYAHASVYVNEQLSASQAYGYSTFYADLTPFLSPGENTVRVQVRNGGMPNSRWYSGSGIYRDVYLLRSGEVRIPPAGIRVATETADADHAVITVETTVSNTSSRRVEALMTTVISQSPEELACARENTRICLNPGETRNVRQRILIGQPKLWSAESPSLYCCRCELTQDGAVLDSAEDIFGIRTLSADPVRGFRINGEAIKLRGACIHHDSGVIGATTYLDAHLRQIRKLKEAGFNAIRMGHHPAAPALLQACDMLGVYVMDEFSDVWTRSKRDLDYAMDFPTCWEKDVTLMVEKDWNHPSVIMYSIGNEIPEIGTPLGSRISAQITSLIKKLDPTRFITAGINGLFIAGDRLQQIMDDISREVDRRKNLNGNVNEIMSDKEVRTEMVICHETVTKRLEQACANLDIAGYNYMTARYLQDSERYPNRMMVGSETMPPEIARNWEIIQKLPSVIGDFTWTGWDYIGEAGIGIPAYQKGEGGLRAKHPCQLAYCGDLDITGFRRPLSYYREIVFGLRTQPYIAVQDPAHYGEEMLKTSWIMSDAKSAWDWESYENKPIVVEVYAPGEEAELIVNGQSIGRKKLNDFKAEFETVYVPGELTAVAYEAGKELGSFQLASPGRKTEIQIAEDYEGAQLLYLNVLLTDEDGSVVTGRDEILTVSVSGAELLGFGSADPKPLLSYQSAQTKSWNGRAMMILKKTAEQEITVTVSSESGMKSVYHTEKQCPVCVGMA